MPIPKTIVDAVRRETTGSWLDTLWKAGILLLLLVLVVTLTQLGIVGGVIAFIIISSLVSDGVRSVVEDLWHRRFWKP